MGRAFRTGSAISGLVKKTIQPVLHGSGLGLWLVIAIVERAGEVLQFDDNEPRGTTMRVVFRSSNGLSFVR